MLSIQAVTVVTSHDQFNKGHVWMDTKQMVANHKLDKLPQNAPVQSEAQEAKLSQGTHKPDKLSKGSMREHPR